MNAHMNLGALRRTRPAGKVGTEPAPSTPRKSPAEEGVITAEFAVALPAVTAGRAREVHVRVSRPAPGVIGSATGWVLRADAHARVEGGGENDAENGAGHGGE